MTDNKKCKRYQDCKVGEFVAYILLDTPKFSLDTFLEEIKETWHLDVPHKALTKKEEKFFSFLVDDIEVIIKFYPKKIEQDFLKEAVETNTFWISATEVAQEHKAFIEIQVQLISEEQEYDDLLNTGVLFTQLCTSLLKEEHATGLINFDVLLEKEEYIDDCEYYLGHELLPIDNLIFCGFYSRDESETFCAYTLGMKSFDKKEIEVIDSFMDPEEIHQVLIDVSMEILSEDENIKDGEIVEVFDVNLEEEIENDITEEVMEKLSDIETLLRKIPARVSESEIFPYETIKLEL